MSDIFISYKREDVARVALLVQALQKDGFDVWWDQSLPGGESWRTNIDTALETAKCVIVGWTKMSSGPMGDFVRDEAGRAKQRGVLVPVLLERGAKPPLGFGEVQAIDLSQWRGNRDDAFYKDLVEACRAKIESRPAKPASAKAKRLMRRVTLAAAFSTITAVLGAFGLDAMNSQALVCRAPVLQPTLSDTCGYLHLGNMPTREERVDFEAIPSGSCEALSAYRAKHESSPLRPVVDSRLNDRHPSSEPLWTARTVSLPLFHSADETTYPSLAAAQQGAPKSAEGEGRRLCNTLVTSGNFRLNGLRVNADKWQCDKTTDGYRCGFDGTVVCETGEKSVSYVCGAGSSEKPTG